MKIQLSKMSSEIELDQQSYHTSHENRQADDASGDEQPDDRVNDVSESDERLAEGGYGWVVVFALFSFTAWRWAPSSHSGSSYRWSSSTSKPPQALSASPSVLLSDSLTS